MTRPFGIRLLTIAIAATGLSSVQAAPAKTSYAETYLLAMGRKNPDTGQTQNGNATGNPTGTTGASTPQDQNTGYGSGGGGMTGGTGSTGGGTTGGTYGAGTQGGATATPSPMPTTTTSPGGGYGGQ